MKKADVQEKISILKCPKFWKIKTNDMVNSRSEFFQKGGRKMYNMKKQWGYLYND